MMSRREVAAEVAVLIAYFVVGVVSHGIEEIRSRLRRT